MTTAYWWWSKSEVSVLVPVLEPPVLEPPVLANPGNLTYQVGVSVNLRIDNNGGAATTWDANALPIGLSITEEYDDHCIISGVPQALIAPSVVDPGDQTWSVGNPKNLPLSNIGGPANLWEEVDNPVNIRITESRDYSALIQNVDALPLPPLKLDYFVEYLLGQQEEQDGGYPGHGQECIDEWECYEATLDLPGCIGQLSTSLHFYDYARSSMAAYYFLQSGGMPADSRWIDYASADTKFWGLYASQLSNPYVMQGYYYFPAGQRALYDFDPVTFAQNAITLREFVDNNNWCDGANWDAGDGRETRTREFSFGILCYLDYLTLPTTAPDDPRWSI